MRSKKLWRENIQGLSRVLGPDVLQRKAVRKDNAVPTMAMELEVAQGAEARRIAKDCIHHGLQSGHRKMSHLRCYQTTTRSSASPAARQAYAIISQATADQLNDYRDQTITAVKYPAVETTATIKPAASLRRLQKQISLKSEKCLMLWLQIWSNLVFFFKISIVWCAFWRATVLSVLNLQQTSKN